MFYFLKRHPLSIRAFFKHSLVLTYAFPKPILQEFLPPGLMLDTYQDYGFLAIAMVQTQSLGPTFLPEGIGQNFFLSGYRIFSRYKTKEDRTLRGLRILRSDTDKRLMAFFGNLLTHYHYKKAKVLFQASETKLEVKIQTPQAVADLHVIADLSTMPAPLPENSPFPDLKEARKFAGPLPYTFDYEPETHSIIRIEGVRQHWEPQAVSVKVLQNTFIEKPPFYQKGILANAFHIQNIPYRWKPGIREALLNVGEE